MPGPVALAKQLAWVSIRFHRRSMLPIAVPRSSDSRLRSDAAPVALAKQLAWVSVRFHRRSMLPIAVPRSSDG
jgi:hypothetical protein